MRSFILLGIVSLLVCTGAAGAGEPSGKKPGKLPSFSGASRVDEIELPEAVKYVPGQRKPSLHVWPLPKGGARLGWTDKKGNAHISTLSEKLAVEDKDIVVPDFDLRGLVVHEDGAVGMMGAQLPHKMLVKKLDAAGKELFSTLLIGDKGRDEGGHFLDDHFSFTGRFAHGNERYAVHFGHMAHHGKGGVHQGGYFATVGPKGNILRKDEWFVSHSLDQRLLFHRGNLLLLSAGDCFPKGILVKNRTLNKENIIYPEPDKREKFGNCAGFVNAKLGSMVPAGDKIAVTFLTKIDDSHELMYFLVEEDGRVLRQVQLTDTPKADEQAVRLAPFGEHLLLVWQESAKLTRAAIMDYRGAWLTEPKAVEGPLTQNDDLVTFPSGDVGWLTARDGDTKLRLVRILKK